MLPNHIPIRLLLLAIALLTVRRINHDVRRVGNNLRRTGGISDGDTNRIDAAFSGNLFIHQVKVAAMPEVVVIVVKHVK